MEKLFPDDDDRLVARLVSTPGGRQIGAGLFASGRFAPGETVLRLDWSDEERTEILSWDDTEEEHHNRCAAVAPQWYFYISDQHPFWYLNHSCAANVAFSNWAQSVEDEMIPLVALREIHPGDEITLDYSLTISAGDGLTAAEPYALECRCGLPDCRRLITAFVGLPRELQLRELLRRAPFSGTIPAFIVNEAPELVKELQREAPDLYNSFSVALESQLRLAAQFESEYDPEEPYFLA